MVPNREPAYFATLVEAEATDSQNDTNNMEFYFYWRAYNSYARKLFGGSDFHGEEDNRRFLPRISNDFALPSFFESLNAWKPS